MRYARLALGLASVAFVGCGGAGRGGGSTVRDSAGVRIVENAEPSSIAPWRVPDEPALSLGAIEGDSVYEFTRITGALRFDDGRIVIADGSQELRFFDADGRFLHESGGAGEGPGEFQRISHFTRLLHDSLLAFEMFQMRASILDQNGTFGRTFRIEQPTGSFRLMPVGQFADGGFLVTAGAFAVGQMEAPARVEREPQSVYKYGPGRTRLLPRAGGGGFQGSPRQRVQSGLSGVWTIDHLPCQRRPLHGGRQRLIRDPGLHCRRRTRIDIPTEVRSGSDNRRGH